MGRGAAPVRRRLRTDAGRGAAPVRRWLRTDEGGEALRAAVLRRAWVLIAVLPARQGGGRAFSAARKDSKLRGF